jgi:hypothetical protein
MKSNDYKVAGYVAILAVIAFVVEIIVTFASQTLAYGEFFSPNVVAATLLLHVAFASYATYCLRSFLQERYGYHGVDTLIVLLVGGGIILAIVLIASEYFEPHGMALVARIVIGISLGIVSMIFGYRFLAVDGDIGGFKKPFAYCHILAPLSFMSVILAPVGLLLLLVANTLLALIFFSEEDQQVEFV